MSGTRKDAFPCAVDAGAMDICVSPTGKKSGRLHVPIMALSADPSAVSRWKELESAGELFENCWKLEPVSAKQLCNELLPSDCSMP